MINRAPAGMQPVRLIAAVLLPSLLLAIAAQATAQPPSTETVSVAQCRAARHEQPATARDLCRRALQLADDAEARFELRMHLAELAIGAADWSDAGDQLDRAADDVARVADPLAAHRLARRRGMLAFRRGENALALAAFLEALDSARRQENQRAEAISENDLGIVYRQLGEDREALTHWLASLALKRSSGDTDLAATFANLGNLYRDLGDRRQARSFLEQAVQGYRELQRPLQVAHSQEALALLSASDGDPESARRALTDIWDRYAAAGAATDQLRVAQHLARLALDQQQIDAARHWLDAVRPLLADAGAAAPLELILLEARLLRQAGDGDVSFRRLQSALPWPPQATPSLQVEAWRELSESAARSGHPEDALAYLKSAEALDDELEKTRHGEQMNALRVRFELADLERERARLQSENTAQQLLLETRRRQMLSLGLAALLLAGLLSLYFQRRLYRQRLLSQAREAEQRARAERAQREAEALRADLRSVQLALDETSEALLVIDAAGHIRSANQPAATQLRRGLDQIIGRTLPQLFGEQAARQLLAAQEQVACADENTGGDSRAAETVSVTTAAGSLQVRVRNLSLEEELGVLALQPAADSDWLQRLDRNHGGLQPTAGSADPAGTHDEFRQHLVDLMRSCLELWERITRSTRIELAERSGIWRVTIDDGRLRTRTLDRYLALDTLPARPRWREAVRTAYFVLAECPLEPGQREQLESRLRAVLERSSTR